MCRWPREGVQVTGGFCLLVIWFAMANGAGTLWMLLAAAVTHEMGHWVVLRLTGAAVTRLRITVFGAEMQTERWRLSYGTELASLLAGPAANLLAGLIWLWAGGPPAPAGAQLVLCAFNLLPVRPLDGGRALETAASWALGPVRGEQAARWIGGAAALGLAAAVLWLIWRSGGSLWLLPPAAGLLMAAARELTGGNILWEK